MALRYFSQDVLARIVAHELGHFAAGDTDLSRRCGRRRLLMRVLAYYLVSLVPSVRTNPVLWMVVNLLNPVPWLIVAYHRLFELVYGARPALHASWIDRGPRETFALLRFGAMPL